MKEKVGCCGLVCVYCGAYKKQECPGCREKEEKCSICTCAMEKSKRGCWECEQYACEGKDFYGGVRSQAFISCAKEEGVETLENYLARNEEDGIKYHNRFGSDYDRYTTVEEILKVLRNGEK